MIEIVTPTLVGSYTAELEAMYRLRYRVFKERLKWEVETRNGMERDGFDDLSPTYLLAYDAAENIVGTWRLLPTTGPNMLRDVFPELLEGQPAPCDPAIWETSRFAVDCGLDGDEGLRAVNRITSEMFCGLVEYGIGLGVTEIVTVYDIRIARLLGRVGCEPTWQSRRRRVGGTIAIAGRFDVDDTVLANLRAAGGITSSVIRRSRRLREREAA